jgi:hypothetical protein
LLRICFAYRDFIFRGLTDVTDGIFETSVVPSIRSIKIESESVNDHASRAYADQKP